MNDDQRRAFRDARNDYYVETATQRKRALARKIAWRLFWAAAFLGLLERLIY
jgi:hypothetical protein